MKIKWFPPFDRMFGKESELHLERPESVAVVLTRLKDQQPDFEPYARFSPQDSQPHGLLIWRKGQGLGLNDILSPDDEVEIIVMVAGG